PGTSRQRALYQDRAPGAGAFHHAGAALCVFRNAGRTGPCPAAGRAQFRDLSRHARSRCRADRRSRAGRKPRMSMLAGIKVLEIADGLTDFGGRMLAELGADVTVVLPETPQATARERAWHHGKTRVTADSTEPIRALAHSVDIILDGQRNGDRFALSSAITLQTIYVRVTPFSATGPYAGRPASDLTLFALSGLMHVTGEPSGSPLKFPGQQAYALTGIQAATAALMALYARRNTGKGQTAELSAFQSTTLANYREAVMYEWTGRIGRRQGNLLVRGKSG